MSHVPLTIYDYSLNTIDLSQLPSTFYRVTVKAVVFDDERRLLVLVNRDGDYELPGGGMEHGESLADCLRREAAEELHAEVAKIGHICCVYSHPSKQSHIPIVRIVVRATLKNHELRPDDTLVDYRFVSKDEFLKLDMRCEGGIQDFADLLWQTSLKD